jgi:hypothetical protein
MKHCHNPVGAHQTARLNLVDEALSFIQVHARTFERLIHQFEKAAPTREGWYIDLLTLVKLHRDHAFLNTPQYPYTGALRNQWYARRIFVNTLDVNVEGRSIVGHQLRCPQPVAAPQVPQLAANRVWCCVRGSKKRCARRDRRR